MRKHSSDRGSALLIAIIVVMLAAGIGGSFLVVNLANTKAQATISEQDELMSMCDAGMERAKQALDIYRGYTPAGYVAPNGNQWMWNDILSYCANTKFAPVDFLKNYTLPPDAKDIKDDYLDALTNTSHPQFSQFKNYAKSVSWEASGTVWGNNTIQAALTIPVNPTTPVSQHAIDGAFVGWNVPFHKGAIHVYVHNNGGTLTDEATGLPILDPITKQEQVDSPEVDMDRLICITVTATLPNGLTRQVEGMYRLPPPPPPISADVRAAVTSQDNILTEGNVAIDGRDFSEDGTKVVGDGVWGILSTKKITVKGASAVGGSGNEPPKAGIAANSTKSNGSDEFPKGYPQNPDEVLNLSKGDLKKAAMASGTYFTSETEYVKKMPATGWDGKIVYVDFDPSPSFQIGGDKVYNDKPSILVVHNDTGSTTVKNTKGFFKGLLIADSVNHTSAPGGTIGAWFMLSPTAAESANQFGTGNTPIKFSSAVLSNLPRPGNPNSVPSILVSYRRVQ